MAEDLKVGFTQPMIPIAGESRAPEFNTFSPDSMLIHAPGGALDLSLYNYHPMPQRVHPSSSQQVISHEPEEEPDGQPQKQQVPMVGAGVGAGARVTKMKKFKGPRRSSVLERFIALLEDKRIMEDSEDAHQLEDIKMPRLRNVLNIIFITAGVCFLLAVVIVILYTTFARYVSSKSVIISVFIDKPMVLLSLLHFVMSLASVRTLTSHSLYVLHDLFLSASKPRSDI